ncbi:hypothetical protein PENTCL1PPCAC_28738 [Pristionchus entomophagus]|uniref:Dehydrogenase n=1 Tax=Pristionchus entomophagus TaxID=358040 RepID=A0AAV5UKV8_9BILA|nr:hypothetical protein PENTCL1PPCAC_28738 [Pristionchus entomophagus]
MTKTVVITGGNRGIGLGMVKELLKRSDVGKLFATTRNPAKSPELKAISDPRLQIVQMDVESDDSVYKGVHEVSISKALGSSGVDILINNAGVLISVDINTPINRKDAEHNFKVNCVSVMVVTQAFHDLLKTAAKQNGHSLIVNVGALLASNKCLHGSGPRHFTGYAMSKAGMNMFTTNVSLDWKEDGIRCVVLHPGWVQTDMGGAEAPLTVEESTSCMVDTIFKLKEEHNGLFYDWKLNPIPW